MAKFKAHLREGITMLQKGQAIHTRMGRGARKPADKKAYTGESEKVVIGLVLKTPRNQTLKILVAHFLCTTVKM